MQRVKAKAPAQYKQHVADTEKRLNILFDHLNNEDLLKPDTIQQMNELASNIQARQYDNAAAVFSDLMTNKNDEGSNWMVSRVFLFNERSANHVTGWCQAIDPIQQADACLKYAAGDRRSLMTVMHEEKRGRDDSRVSVVCLIENGYHEEVIMTS
jgi:hypothetical protein